ncbi:MAG: hypothetical protein JWR52_3668 [Marmoricola sp.]|nr:hypothetical protein [Marmoricola sp.]
MLGRVLEWADAHQVADPDDQQIATFGDTPVSLAGAGAPHVSQFAVLEFGAVLGMSRRSVELLFADVIELGHRLPTTWARVAAGELRVWRARQVAQATQILSPEAAAYVDAQVARYASRISPAELQRLVDAAIVRFMPRHAEDVAARAEESQFLEIAYDQPSYTGTCRVSGELDLPDAQDLEQAVRAGAAQQQELGSQLSLGARRAKALGNLARGELEFDYNSGLPEPAEGSTLGDVKPPTVQQRQVVLYLHLADAALAGSTGQSGVMENAGRHLVTADQVRDWCSTAGRVTVRPVLDLAEHLTTTSYQPTDRLREQVILRDRVCAFPFCERNARHGDLDHIEAYDPDGPPDQTNSDNLASLCRTHHRMKTFDQWSYTAISPGTYLWRSPHGYSFLVDQTGTRDLTPRPVDPPGN